MDSIFIIGHNQYFKQNLVSVDRRECLELKLLESPIRYRLYLSPVDILANPDDTMCWFVQPSCRLASGAQWLVILWRLGHLS